jgi:hypothetical protein
MRHEIVLVRRHVCATTQDKKCALVTSVLAV